MNKLLAVGNLYNYHCCIEIFKILKFRTPIALYSLLNISDRNNSMLLLTPTPSAQFMYNGPRLWNIAYKKLMSNSQYDHSTNLSLVKSSLKNLLLTNQNKYDKDEWCVYNFTM